jgi:hypothetical protein
LKKAAQKLFLRWAWGFGRPTPQAQSKKSFLVLFFKKEPLAFMKACGRP